MCLVTKTIKESSARALPPPPPGETLASHSWTTRTGTATRLVPAPLGSDRVNTSPFLGHFPAHQLLPIQAGGDSHQPAVWGQRRTSVRYHTWRPPRTLSVTAAQRVPLPAGTCRCLRAPASSSRSDGPPLPRKHQLLQAGLRPFSSRVAHLPLLQALVQTAPLTPTLPSPFVLLQVREHAPPSEDSAGPSGAPPAGAPTKCMQNPTPTTSCASPGSGRAERPTDPKCPEGPQALFQVPCYRQRCGAGDPSSFSTLWPRCSGVSAWSKAPGETKVMLSDLLGKGQGRGLTTGARVGEAERLDHAERPQEGKGGLASLFTLSAIGWATCCV